jgi:hypothetical protein
MVRELVELQAEINASNNVRGRGRPVVVLLTLLAAH